MLKLLEMILVRKFSQLGSRFLRVGIVNGQKLTLSEEQRKIIRDSWTIADSRTHFEKFGAEIEVESLSYVEKYF